MGGAQIFIGNYLQSYIHMAYNIVYSVQYV